MGKFQAVSDIKIINAGVLTGARQLPDESIHMIVTSPPYYGLRDYQLPPQTWPDGWIGQLGLEPNPQLFIEHMIMVMREAWRVLRKDGTIWINIGDSYYNYRPGNYDDNRAHSFGGKRTDEKKRGLPSSPSASKRGQKIHGLKEKDLIGIPHMLAFAMRDDGWYWRDEIIWRKPNVMPSSVKDRCTRQHEYVFMFAKQRHYFYDNTAIEELASANTNSHGANPVPTGWDKTDGGHRRLVGRYKNIPTGEAIDPGHPTRNKRSVWDMTTHGYKGKHYATFCTELPETAILAGTSARGVCPECAAPWKRVVVKGAQLTAWQRACGANALGGYTGTAIKDYDESGAQDPSAVKARILAGMREKKTVGWQPTCKCGILTTVPATVADFFGGSMTTALVASRLQRDAVMLELSTDYIEDGVARLHDDSPMLNFIEVLTGEAI